MEPFWLKKKKLKCCSFDANSYFARVFFEYIQECFLMMAISGGSCCADARFKIDQSGRRFSSPAHPGVNKQLPQISASTLDHQSPLNGLSTVLVFGLLGDAGEAEKTHLDWGRTINHTI